MKDRAMAIGFVLIGMGVVAPGTSVQAAGDAAAATQ